MLQLTAVAPLTTGESFRLPGIQSQDMAWQEGTADLLVPDTLVLDQLSTIGCRQSRLTALPAPLAGESFEIQYFRPGAVVEVLLSEPRRKLDLAAAASVRIDAEEIISRCTLEIASGRQQTVRIPIGSDWTIDAVENHSAQRPLEWDVDESHGKRAHLKIVPDGNEPLVVRGHRRLPPAPQFDASKLEMLDFSPFGGQTRLISVRAAEGSELRWTGLEEIERYDATTLSAEQLQLFPQIPEGVVFTADDRFLQTTLGLQRRKPTYTADIHIDAAVQQDRLTETFTIQCTPEAARVERLLVHFSQAREAPLEWNLAGGNNSGQFSARKLSTGEQLKAGLPGEGEVWELILQLTRPGAFELRGQRSVPFTAETPLALASVDDATTQRGTLAIRALGNSGLSIKNRGLMSVPAELLEQDRYQTARATYHYQPSGDDLEAEPIVSIAPARPEQSETGAWVWNLRLTSRFAADGRCAHRAVAQVQTSGRRRLRLQLPPQAELHAALLDDERLGELSDTPDKNEWEIEFPAGHRRATLVLEYSTPSHLPTLVTRQEAPFPTLDVPIFLREWSVWMPPGYRVTGADDRALPEQVAPPTWSQRLFGPLGRGRFDHVFNPLVASDWRETFAGSQQLDQGRQTGGQFVENLGVLAGDYLDGEDLTWGQLLSSAGETETQFNRTLVLDAAGLASAAITPQTRVRLPSADSPGDRGRALLRQSGMVAVAVPSAVLLTAASAATRYGDQLVADPADVVYGARRGALAREIAAAARGGRWSQFENVEVWRAGGNEPSAWAAWQRQDPRLADFQGWTSYTLRSSDAVTPAIRIAHAARMRSLAWAVFLAAVGLGLWRPVGRAWMLVAVIGLAAAGALVVPAAYAPLLSAVLLAGLFCLAALMTDLRVPRLSSNDASARSYEPSGSRAHPVATLLVFGALIHAAAALDAAPPAEQPSAQAAGTKDSAGPPIYAVFVPVDEDGQPAGDKYYVPDELYADLLRRSDTINGRPKDWLLSRATYQGILAHDPVTSRLGLSRFKARFDLQVFQSKVSVGLPLAREPWSGAITGIRLDGRTLAASWNDAGDELTLGELDAGQFRLELDVQPVLQADNPQTGFDLPVPRLANATLELTVPMDAPLVDVPTALGRVAVDRQRGELVARLGATDRLSVRWTPGGGMDAATPNLEVEELIWMKVRPGTTVLDARFKYRVLSGRVRHLRLLTDPRLRLLSSPDSQSPVVAVHTIPGDPQRIDLELGRTVTDEVNVDLSFLVTGASGVGNLRLPQLESSDAKATRRWLAVSVDPALQPRVQAGEDSRFLNIDEFVNAWNTEGSKPHAAYSIPRGEPIWFLATQPNEPQTSVDQTLSLSLGRSQARLQFNAELSITGGVLVQLRLDGPAGLEVDKISIVEDEVEHVARWSVDGNGHITVFLTAAVEGRQRLSLTGRWTPPENGAFEAPRIQVTAADTKRDQLQLFRQPAVLASAETHGPVRQPDKPSERSDDPRPDAPCGSYLLEGPESGVRITLSPNLPDVRAVAVTYLERDEDRWIAELHYDVDVRQGLADTLQFEIPAQWSEPFHVEPAMRSRVALVPGEQRRQLILYPDEPLSGSQLIKLRGAWRHPRVIA